MPEFPSLRRIVHALAARMPWQESNRRAPWAWVSLLGPLFGFACLIVLFTACGDPAAGRDATQGVRIEARPTRLVLDPQTTTGKIELVNVGDRAAAVADFRIQGSDWASFSIVDPLSRRTLRPGQSLTFTVAVDPESLRGPSASVESVVADEPGVALERGEYRDGAATLQFSAGGQPQSVPLLFQYRSWVWTQLLPALVKVHVLALGFVLPLAALLTWLERKQSALMQDRVGPNMARVSFGGVTLRLWGLLHIITDGIKMLFKEDFIPRRAHRVLYGLAPLLALAPAMTVFAIVPFGDALCYEQLFQVTTQADIDQCATGRGGTPLQVARIDVGLLFYFAIASLATYGTTLAGWASYNKWAVLGALRASAQMISYEVALGLTVVGALLVYGSLEPHALVRAQMDSSWGILLQPVAFILFLTAAIAETKRAPFDLPEGESEIIGYFIEYSGMRFGLFYLSEFMEVVFVSAIVTTLFLGGWALPFGALGASGFSSAAVAQLCLATAGIVLLFVGIRLVRSNPAVRMFGVVVAIVGGIHLGLAVVSLFTGWGTQLPHLAVVLLGMVIWGVKVVVLCWVQLLIRWTLPRFRYDQLMNLGWKGLLPLSVANIVLTALVVYALTPTAPPAPSQDDAHTQGPKE